MGADQFSIFKHDEDIFQINRVDMGGRREGVKLVYRVLLALDRVVLAALASELALVLFSTPFGAGTQKGHPSQPHGSPHGLSPRFIGCGSGPIGRPRGFPTLVSPPGMSCIKASESPSDERVRPE